MPGWGVNPEITEIAMASMFTAITILCYIAGIYGAMLIIKAMIEIIREW